MSKKVKCPSCDMAGDLEGEDYKLVTTYRGRPVVQCFWCDSHVMIRRMGSALVLDLNHKAIRHLRSDLDHEEMVSLLLDHEDESRVEGSAGVEVLPAGSELPAEDLVAAAVAESSAEAGAATPAEELLAAAVEAPVEVQREQVEVPEPERLVAIVRTEEASARPAPRRRRSRKTAPEPQIQVADFEPVNLPDFEPVMLAEAAPAVLDNSPAVVNPSPDQHDTPVPTAAELVASIPVTARALDHDSLMHIAAQIGWGYNTPVRKQPEWMKVLEELPPPVQMGKFRTKLQNYINMMKYYRVNAGTKEQRRAETAARRLRLVEYRKRMFEEKLDALNAVKAIEYKAKAV
ncbi:MAG TPA: hypothetical protein VHJ78_12600 [Actinomycetota bacterium]|nr:hypothetical protein [Actinomycetota bacterium]